ncbi:hypothetical protein ACFQ0M_46275 [Kitasatospora aburaviensis]|uniref:DUF1707 domain-containing protein n=1 Tax=Kitasatospora aburaviensis TaxID=67265 RepID=A0ABW1F636_9ACTN
MTSPTSASSGGPDGAAAPPQALRLEANEKLVLSPDSPRFASGYRQVRPQSIDEVRKLLGPVNVPDGRSRAENLLAARVPELTKRLLRPEDLRVKDPNARAEARRLAYLAAREYIHTANTSSLKQWRPIIDQWLVEVKPVISIFTAGDIDIADGATLTLSANTHALMAQRIRMHGSGRIVCRGSVKISAVSVDGS